MMNSGLSRSLRTHVIVLLLFSSCYFAGIVTLAARRHMWSDEIQTYHFSRLPSLQTLWRGLSEGPEGSGPLLFLSVRGAYALMGDTPLATRMPSVIGVWVMACCLYAFVARRYPPAVALVALLFPLTTNLFYFSIEGRPYGLFLGFTGLGLLCWQAASEGRGRPWSVLGLWLSLALAVAAHYYAVLVFIPFGLAELTRTARRKRVDVPVWFALFGGLIPLAFCVPLLRNTASYSVYTRGGISWLLVIDFYDWLLEKSQLPLLGALGLVALIQSLGVGRSASVEAGDDQPPPPAQEVVAAGALVILPVFMIALGKLATGVTQHRYCVPAAAGIGLLLAFVVGRLRGRESAGYTIGGVLSVWLLLAVFGRALISGAYSDKYTRGNPLEIPVRGGLPVATHDLGSFLQNNYYANDEVNASFCYITGVKDCLTETMAKKMRPWVSPVKPLVIRDYPEFVAAHDRFLIYGSRDSFDSIGVLVDRLKADGATVELVDTKSLGFGGGQVFFQLYEVTKGRWRDAGAAPPASPAPSAASESSALGRNDPNPSARQ
jgi:hypothetical protein